MNAVELQSIELENNITNSLSVFLDRLDGVAGTTGDANQTMDRVFARHSCSEDCSVKGTVPGDFLLVNRLTGETFTSLSAFAANVIGAKPGKRLGHLTKSFFAQLLTKYYTMFNLCVENIVSLEHPDIDGLYCSDDLRREWAFAYSSFLHAIREYALVTAVPFRHPTN